MTTKTFPIQVSHLYRDWPVPNSIPWSIIEPHREQAHKNHDQTLERLAERAGLDPAEMVAVLTDRHWGDVRDYTPQQAAEELKLILEERQVESTD